MTTPTESRVILLQTVVPAYRLEVFRRLSERGFHFIFGEESYEATVRSARAACQLPGRRVVNRFVAGRRLLWQRGAVGPVVRSAVAVVEINPRALSTWVALICRLLLGRPTIGWGHATGRSHQRSPRGGRRLMWATCSGLLAYTDAEAKRMRSATSKPVSVAPNALYDVAEIEECVRSRTDTPFRLLVSGRLIPSKRPDVILEAWIDLPDADGLVLTFVGDGPELPRLKAMSAGHRNSVEFLGRVHDREQLRALYEETVATASAGYVGLSLVQSISHGVPMLYAREQPHSPEVDLAMEGCNAFGIPGDIGHNWTEAMGRLLQLEPPEAKMVAAMATDRHNLSEMVGGIVQAVEAARPAFHSWWRTG